MNIDIYPDDFPITKTFTLNEEVKNLRISQRLAILKQIYNRRIVTQLIIANQDSEAIPTRMPFNAIGSAQQKVLFKGRVGYWGGGLKTNLTNLTPPFNPLAQRTHTKFISRFFYAGESASKSYARLTTPGREHASAISSPDAFWVFGGWTDAIDNAPSGFYGSIEKCDFFSETTRKLGSRLTYPNAMGTSVGNASNAYLLGGRTTKITNDYSYTWDDFSNQKNNLIERINFATNSVSVVGNIADANNQHHLSKIGVGMKQEGYFFGGLSKYDSVAVAAIGAENNYHGKKIHKLNYTSLSWQELANNLSYRYMRNNNYFNNKNSIYLFSGVTDDVPLHWFYSDKYTSKFAVQSQAISILGNQAKINTMFETEGAMRNSLFGYIFEIKTIAERQIWANVISKFSSNDETLENTGILLDDTSEVPGSCENFIVSDYSASH